MAGEDWEEHGHLEVSFLPYPLGVHSREVPGSHRPSQHHSEVLYQEFVAQRCVHNGELPARLEDGLVGDSPASHSLQFPTLSRFPLSPAFALLTPCFSDSGDGVLGPCGCGRRRSPLVGYPLGSAGRAAGAGSACAAVVEGEAWGRMEPVGTGIRGRWLAAHSHRFIQQLLPRELTLHAPGTPSAQDVSELAPVQTWSSRLV